ncbi:MAG: sigma-70 family RNA polymerase sigma factor [Candidatus Latescibacteria bacterium]|nr:sigma-70 family RNA polymerase sigma factor [Candidatus Latescibacterota bacterium]
MPETPDPTRTRFESHLTPILDAAYGIALHLTHNRDDAADVIQEAAFRAFRAFHTFQEGTRFKSWFFRILTNVFLEVVRKKQREPEVEEVPEDLYLYTQTRNLGLHSGNSDPASVILRKIEAEQVQDAIAALPEEYRIVSALYFMEELSYQEIADIAGCPVGTVRSRLHRGRKLLQKALWQIAERQGIIAALNAQGGT